jgi:signal transduction histidine kinase
MTVDWDAFLAHLVHDVRGLARVGLLNTQLLQREADSPLNPGRLNAIAASQQRLDRLMGKVSRFMDAARADRAALWSDLQDLDVLVLGARLEQKAALNEAGAEVSIQWVFSELLHNACQFRDPARPLRIEVRATCAEDGLLRCSVTDNGVGWTPAYSGKLFGPFERLHAGTDGFGLGLAISQLLVEAAGGRISGEPQSPGARFVLELPSPED